MNVILTKTISHLKSLVLTVYRCHDELLYSSYMMTDELNYFNV